MENKATLGKHIIQYHKSVNEAYRLGNIESSYYQPICALLSAFGCVARDMSGERGGQAGENVDIKLWYSQSEMAEAEPFAAIEVKKVGGIDTRARGSQIQALTERYSNVILTDNLRWYFYNLENGKAKYYTAVELIASENGILKLHEENIELFESLIKDFILKDPATIKSSEMLAEYMAAHARTIRSVIKGILKEGEAGQPLVNERQTKLPMFGEIYSLYIKIKEGLQPYLDTASFADMYAQTIVYGLFIARYNDTDPADYNRYDAIGNLRKESALLKLFFSHIALATNQHPTLEAVIDKLCRLYRVTDVVMLLDKDEEKDTIIHFYEEFLSFYDPGLRKTLGVFYTPYQVVRYMVRMVDRVLTDDFRIDGGLSNNETVEIELKSNPHMVGKKEKTTITRKVPRVSILDPALGTATFHAEIIKHVKDTYFSGCREPFWREYILDGSGSLLSRLIGFEIMMTSYVVAHLKVRRTIHETLGAAEADVDIPQSRIFLTNTLSPPQVTLEEAEQMSLFAVSDFSGAVTEEARQADKWKSRRPVRVIIGNPPYNVSSTTTYDYSSYRTETDGLTALNERNSKVLGDDYVKFIHFSQMMLEKEKQGVLSFIAPHGYFDNPVFRGMRASLLRTFDKIFVLDLHGNSIKKETCLDGSKDENVFDIRQGVGIITAIRNGGSSEWGKVYHSEIFGTRQQKLDALENGDIEFKSLDVIDINMAYFVPTASEGREEYERGVSIAELFPLNSVGVITGRTNMAIQNTKEEMENVISDFLESDVESLRSRYSLSEDTRDWRVDWAKADLMDNSGAYAHISLTPLDNRFTYYTGVNKGFHTYARHAIMRHMLVGYRDPPLPYDIQRNIGITFAKQTSHNNEWDGIFVSDQLIERHFIDYPARGTGYIAPLFLKTEGEAVQWQPNIDPALYRQLVEHLESEPPPIDVFDYIYGLLHDPTYREKYGAYLKRDFPRVPIINAPEDRSNINTFYVSEERYRAYVKAGRRLRKIHLMQDKVPEKLELSSNDTSDLEIGSIKYKDGILHLNAKKKILGIKEEVWNYRIGGYQVLDKWFKSHKGDTLTISGFTHICNVAGLLAETIKIQLALRNLGYEKPQETRHWHKRQPVAIRKRKAPQLYRHQSAEPVKHRLNIRRINK